MSEATTQETPVQTRQPNVRFLVRGLPWFVRARELNAAAKEANIPARFDMGRSFRSGTRTSFVISKTEEQNEQAQEFLQKWLNENFARLDATAVERTKAEAKEGEAEATEVNETTEVKEVKEKPAATAPTLSFTKLPPRPRRSNGSPAASKGESNDDSTDETKDDAAKTDQSGTSDQTSDQTSEKSGEKSEASKAKTSKRKPKSARKPATQKVPRDDAVYIKVPGNTTLDEIRELLTGFSPVEIKLRHIRRRVFRRKVPEETQTNLAEAIVTVGADNQQKAIDTLAGKELHGKPLNPVPSYRKMLLNAAQDEQQPSPEEQTSVEHIE